MWILRILGFESREAAQRRADDAAWKARRRQEEADRLRQHQAAFRCNVCGSPSSGPGTSRTPKYNDEGKISLFGDRPYTDWGKPKGLYYCSRGNHWACGWHIFRGICNNCANRL